MLIGAFLGIPLFIWGVISALKKFSNQMNFVDWLIVKLAPSLPPELGDLVRVISVVLLVFFAFGLPTVIAKLAKKYLQF